MVVGNIKQHSLETNRRRGCLSPSREEWAEEQSKIKSQSPGPCRSYRRWEGRKTGKARIPGINNSTAFTCSVHTYGRRDSRAVRLFSKSAHMQTCFFVLFCFVLHRDPKGKWSFEETFSASVGGSVYEYVISCLKGATLYPTQTLYPDICIYTAWGFMIL